MDHVTDLGDLIDLLVDHIDHIDHRQSWHTNMPDLSEYIRMKFLLYLDSLYLSSLASNLSINITYWYRVP